VRARFALQVKADINADRGGWIRPADQSPSAFGGA